MKAEIYWVAADLPGRLAIMPRPRGGEWLDDEIRSLREEGVDVLASLLAEEEVAELDLAREPELCRAARIEYLSHPIPDHDVPTADGETDAFVRKLAARVRRGSKVAVHCRGGIGRSGLVAACILLELGLPLHEALVKLAEARGLSVPETAEQLDWVERFGTRCRKARK